MRKVKRFFSGMIAFLLLFASIPMNAYAAGETAITSQPVDQYAEVGDVATFSVEATGQNLNYQWYFSNNGGGSWTKSGAESAKTANYSFTVAKAHDGRQFKCVVSGNNGTATSEIAALHLSAPTSIITQPSDQHVVAGNTATFTVEASGENLTYQWFFSKDGGNSWTMSGAESAKTPNYSFTALKAQDGRMFKCQVTSAFGTITSETATLIIETQAATETSITTQPTDQQVEAGETATFTVEATGKNLTYQWFFSKDGGATWTKSGAESAKTPSYSFIAVKAQDGRKFKCQVTGENGTVTSEIVTLQIKLPEIQEITINSQPQNQSVSEGATATFSVDATGEGLTYQWFFSNNGGENWTKSGAESAKTSSYSFVAARSINGRMFKCQIKDSSGAIKETETAQIIILKPTYTVTYDFGEGYEYINGQYYQTYSEVRESGPFSVGVINGYGTLTPYRDGYHFVGWKHNGRYLNTVVLKSDITFEAEWEEAYSVTFKANGGTIDNIFSPFFETVVNGDEYTKYYPYGYEVMVDNYIPRKDGYAFAGWKYDGKYVKRLTVTGPIELTAEWNPLIAVTYDANGGDIYSYYYSTYFEGDSQTIYYPSGIFDVYENSIYAYREGYIFAGWTLDDSIVNKINLSEPVTLKAKWEEAVKVSFNSNGGCFDGSPESILNYHYYPRGYNDLSEIYFDVSRDGYSFAGWSTYSGANVPMSNYVVNLQGEMTLYAVWENEDKTYNITYEANGGYYWGDSSYTSIIYNDVQEGYYRINETPQKKGYSFLGYSTKSDLSGPLYSYWDIVYLSESVTFYAVWEKSITITYMATNGGYFEKWDYIEEESDYGYVKTDRMIIEKPAGIFVFNYTPNIYDGYNFVGWSLEENGEVIKDGAIFLEEDTVLYAIWEKNITITFYSTNGGYFEKWEYIEEESDYGYVKTDRNVLQDTAGLFCPSDYCAPYNYDGYEFIGWSFEEEGDVIKDIAVDLEDDTELYAIWKKSDICVTFNLNGGYLNYSSNMQYYDSGLHKVWLGERPQRDGYSFIGWSTEQEDTSAGYYIILDLTEDITLYAIWKRQAVITYDAGEGSFDNGYSIVNGYKDIGSRFDFNNTEYINVVDKYTYYDNPVREGYSFAGWTYNGEAPRLMQITDDITVEANWKKTVYINLDAEGGTFGDGSNNSCITYSEGTLITEKGFPIPFKEGYEFDGWLINGERFTQQRVYENITLYASWKEPEEKWTITINAGEGTFSDGQNVKEVQSADGMFYLNLIEQPERDGYYFVSWKFLDDMGWHQYTTSFFCSGDILVEAVWEPTESNTSIYSDMNSGEVDDITPDSSIVSGTIVGGIDDELGSVSNDYSNNNCEENPNDENISEEGDNSDESGDYEINNPENG